jgi:hypothetical protein
MVAAAGANHRRWQSVQASVGQRAAKASAKPDVFLRHGCVKIGDLYVEMVKN